MHIEKECNMKIEVTQANGDTVSVDTELTLGQAKEILESMEWNDFAQRLAADIERYGERVFDSTKNWALVVAQRELDRKANTKTVTLKNTLKFFRKAEPNVGFMAYAEIDMGDHALQLFRNTQHETKSTLVRIRRRHPGTDERDYLCTIQEDGTAVTTRLTDLEVDALRRFNQKPSLTGAVRWEE
jgi:hypothetical protein